MAPTKEYVRRQLELSLEYLDDASALLQQGRLRSAVDRAYYSIHEADMLTALMDEVRQVEAEINAYPK